VNFRHARLRLRRQRSKIDDYLVAKSDAMVFVMAGNNGRDKNSDQIPDPNTVGSPATAKNVLVGRFRERGRSRRPNLRHAGPIQQRLASVFGGRIALVMAPGLTPERPGLSPNSLSLQR
jgi:hypothetical protein